MEISPEVKLFGAGLLLLLIGTGLYLAVRQDPQPPAGAGGFNPYPTPATPPPAQDDVANAVGAGLRFGERILDRFVPSADQRAQNESAAEQRRLEQERFRACLANPTATVCQGALAQRNAAPTT